MDRDSITRTGARAPGVERNTARTEVPARPIVPDTEQGNPDGGRKHEGRWQTRTRGRPHLIFRPLSRTGENPPYGILGEAMETSASFEARSAPLSYPTGNPARTGLCGGRAAMPVPTATLSFLIPFLPHPPPCGPPLSPQERERNRVIALSQGERGDRKAVGEGSLHG